MPAFAGMTVAGWSEIELAGKGRRLKDGSLGGGRYIYDPPGTNTMFPVT
jgi:hypothetical protein